MHVELIGENCVNKERKAMPSLQFHFCLVVLFYLHMLICWCIK